MEIKFGLFSADSHAAFDRSDFIDRMSTKQWGEKIPQIVTVERDGKPVDGWSIYGGRPGVTRGFSFGVCNCPALMGEPQLGRRFMPQGVWTFPLILIFVLGVAASDALPAAGVAAALRQAVRRRA